MWRFRPFQDMIKSMQHLNKHIEDSRVHVEQIREVFLNYLASLNT